jgi:hypothetical protein
MSMDEKEALKQQIKLDQAELEKEEANCRHLELQEDSFHQKVKASKQKIRKLKDKIREQKRKL